VFAAVASAAASSIENQARVHRSITDDVIEIEVAGHRLVSAINAEKLGEARSTPH
jgi:hypothetical protein